MSDLRRNFDLVAILVLVVLLGVLQAPRVRQQFYRVSQQQMAPSDHIPHIIQLICSAQERR